MSDEELSKRLGQYQRMAKLWQILGLIGTIGGLIAYFVVNDRVLKAILVAVLFFGGLCCILFLRNSWEISSEQSLREHLDRNYRRRRCVSIGRVWRNSVWRMDSGRNVK